MQSVAVNCHQLKVDDRRSSDSTEIDHWQRLNAVQKFAFYGLGKFGYELLFVRNSRTSASLAVARLNEQLVTIDIDGEIDFAPDIVLRPH